MVDDLDVRIGRRLREIRLRAGLDIVELARRGAIPAAEVIRYEAGRARVPVDVLTRLAEVLGASVADFFA